TTHQLCNRAGPALHAAIGLDPERRAAVERLLWEQMQDPTLGDDQRTDVAFVVVALENQTPASNAAVAAVLAHVMTKTAAAAAMRRRARGLSAAAGRLEPREAAAVLALAMSKTADAIALSVLAEGLSAVAERLEPKEAAHVSAEAAAALARVMTKTTNNNAL